MLARVHSAAAQGVEGRILDVEVDVSEGLPCFNIVGLPDVSVNEARDRVRAALRNSGFPPPARAVTVNLAPAEMRKFGAALDLPVAVGLLQIAGLTVRTSRRRIFIGELGLNGEVRPVRGALCMALAAHNSGFEEIVLPADNAAEAAAVDGLDVIPVRSLAAAIRYLLGEKPIPPHRGPSPSTSPPSTVDFADVRGQPAARRALEIAAAGGHHILLVGPPGTGKTMLARRLPTILPALTRAEAIEVTQIHSVAGALPAGGGLLTLPPFRAPHHGISAPGLVGGGTRPGPGEISLAHRGALFLDELPEFRRDVLEAIRQPLEERRICLVRVGGASVFPCDVLLIAAMNPCPCGYAGDRRRACTCAHPERIRYVRKLSGPLLDRIDLHVTVPPVSWYEIEKSQPEERSESIRRRVDEARRRCADRFPNRPGFRNADIGASDLERHIPLEADARRLLASVLDRMHLSVRALHRALRVSRTIADLAGTEMVTRAHLAEALAYRARAFGSDAMHLDSTSPRFVR